MGTALIAYIDRDQRRIELDPAVRVGARLDSDGEAVLLHMTAWGHCGDTAGTLARQLRDAGWTVRIRDMDEFAPLAAALSKAGQAASIVAALDDPALASDQATASPAEVEPQPEPEPPSHSYRRPKRQRCRVCGHLTLGRGVRSHVTHIGHDDWETVTLAFDGTYTPAQTQA